MGAAIAAEYIAADTYTGRWMRTFAPRTFRADSYTATELARMFRAEFAVWESSGHTRTGRELFVRARYVPQADGSLRGYDSSGRWICGHPATRQIRILTK